VAVVARYTAAQIYAFARAAGFDRDQATTMTAVALAESGGRDNAHATHGEDSRGLWQINADAHPDLAARYDLFDPRQNALAAFEVARGGRDVSPWTTTHGGSRAKYLSYRMDAEAAARSAGDGTNLGVWTGTPGYGSPLAAGGGGTGGVGTGGPLDNGFGTGQAGGTSTAGDQFVRDALAQAGDRYVFGAEAAPDDANPTVFDCSELTQWAAHRAGVDLPDGSWLQYQTLAKEGGSVSVEQALKTKGALLFYFSEPPTGAGRPSRAHVAISLGDGRTIEARSTKDGVGIFNADTVRFNYAAVIPQFAGAGGAGDLPDVPLPTTPTTPTFPTSPGPAVDTDGDGLTDGRELMLHTDPTRADTDGDGMSDGYELGLHTNAVKADTDGDGIGDSVELATGSDPTSADSDHDGLLDGSTSTLDTDHDGLSDALEKVLGTDPYSLDSDGDGFSDGLEYQGSFDPTDPLSTPLSAPLDPAGALSGSVPGGRLTPSALTGQGLGSGGLGSAGLGGNGLGSGLDGVGSGGAGHAAGLDDLGVG
jgi:cell wall-associated NlpC family hydrolase